MKIVLIATAALFLGIAAVPSAVSAAPATGASAVNKTGAMQDVSARRWHRHHRWCRTYWRHGRRITVCR
jgi:hypothetical protein